MSSPASSWRLRPHPVSDYAVAVLSVAAAVVVDMLFDRLTGADPSISVFLCAVVFVAWAGGTGPALLATALTILAYDCFLLHPAHWFGFQLSDVPRFGLFAVAALVVMSLNAAQRRAAASLRQVRDQQREAVHELQRLNATLRVENAERERAEERARQAEEALRATVDTIPAMVATYRPDGTHSFVNRTWMDYTGLTLEQAVGDQGRSLFHADDSERAAWRAALASGEPLQTEAPIRGADGKYRWHTIRRVPLRGENGEIVKWYSVGFDIEDRKIAEDALRRSEARLASAERELKLTIDSIPVMVTTFEADGTRSFVNQVWQRYTGLTPQEVTGSGANTASHVHPDDAERFENAWHASLLNGEPLARDVRVRIADGKYRWHNIRRVPLRDERGSVVKWYSVGIDIEDQKVAQEALGATQAALAHASRVATLGEISASIAHEVNQPLAAIIANGQACLRFLRRETPDLNDVRGAVEWIVKDGIRAGEVIGRVRGLLKKADTRKVPLDVNDLVNEVTTLLQREFAAQQVTPRLELAPALPRTVADRVQLQQVIINLIMNGVEAMQAITERPHTLVIRSYQDEARQVVVAVKDSGAGIPDDGVDRVFDPFFSTKPGGLGMGLAICRSIIEVHGGRLWSSANEGPGATFQFALPACQETAP